MQQEFNRREVAVATVIPERRVLYYTEAGLLPDVTLPVGRGRRRIYSRRDVFILQLLRELRALGFRLARAADVIEIVKSQHLDRLFDEDGRFTKKKLSLVILGREPALPLGQADVVASGAKAFNRFRNSGSRTIIDLNVLSGRARWPLETKK